MRAGAGTGLALFAQAPPGGAYASHELPVMVLMGAGAGLASGLVNTTMQVGGALGLAILATVSAGRTATLAAHGQNQAAALTGGYHLAFWIAAGLVTAAIAVAIAALRPAPGR